MSYIATLNGYELDLKDSNIALTKQTNDLAKLTNRQSNFTNKFTLSFTKNNKQAMRLAFNTGNQSNIPYQINAFDLIDAETGVHLIYKGMAVMQPTTKQGYNLTVYDGIIEFYKTIENKTLTDMGLQALNHIKNLTTIQNSWTMNLPYKYIIADYNGKLYTNANYLNADYLVPSALRSFIFNKIHQFAGYTFEGLVFNTDLYTNDWLTFPKPVPTTAPLYSSQYIGSSFSTVVQTWYGGVGGVLYNWTLDYFNLAVITSRLNIGTITNRVTAIQAGAYRVTLSVDPAPNGQAIQRSETVYLYTATGVLREFKVLDLITATPYTFVCDATDYLVFGNKLFQLNEPYKPISVTIDFLEGYTVNFDDTLIDLKATDFVNETMVKFGLTAYKDKYRNHIVYKQIKEVLKNTVKDDWSGYYDDIITEKYNIGDYAQQNDFKYKYNNNLERFNDGFFKIENKNLKENKTVFNSLFFSPEFSKTLLLQNYSNVYKMWDKTIKDDNTIEYKDLTNHYYCIRFVNKVWSSPKTIGSDLLGGSFNFTTAPYESFERLKMQQILFDNYKEIGSIFDKAKFITASVYINSVVYEQFNFQRLIYLEQRASYFLVNKIINFVPKKKCTVELIEVDLLTELDIQDVIDYYLNFNDALPATIFGCNITFNIQTNIPTPFQVQVLPYIQTFNSNGFAYTPYTLNEPIYLTCTGDEVNYNATQLPFDATIGGYKFRLAYNTNLYTDLSNQIAVPQSCYVPVAPTVNLSFLTITKVETLSVGTILNLPNQRKIKVTYVSDLNIATMYLKATANAPFFLPYTFDYFLATQNGTLEFNVDNLNLDGTLAVYNITINALQVTSNNVQS